MEAATLLIGFAELAISMAGFTTIATIIVRISDTTTKNFLAVRLKMVLIFSVHLIIISFAPLCYTNLIQILNSIGARAR